jgi:hypothetical protein
MSIAESEAGTALDLSVLIGDWRNTNPAGSITRIVCRPAGEGRMTVRVWTPSRDWGAIDAPVYAFTFDSREAGAFSANYDFGFARVRLQANVKAGVLVVVSLNSFHDESGRSNYFDREFFYRVRR